MFPRIRQQILARVDLLMELSTLGEYGIDADGRPLALDPEPIQPPLASRRRDCCGTPASSAARLSARSRGVPARP